MKVPLATGDEAAARVRRNRVHKRVEGLVPMGQVLAAGKERLAEHDQCWTDPSFTSPLTGVVFRLMREAGREASPDPVDTA